MYKYLSIILCVLVLVLGGMYVFERYSHANSRKDLSEKISELEGMIQETETAYSRRGIEIENLRVKNKELQQKIEDKGEEIISLTNATLKWKDKYFEIKNAKSSIENSSGEPIEIPKECENELEDVRFRVDFDKSKDYLRVYGHTLTNPAYAEVHLKWLRDLNLNIVLTKSDDSYRVYIDSENSDVVPTNLELRVDPKVLSSSWYEKISVGTDISVGPGVQTSLKAVYNILPNYYVGPHVVFQYDGRRYRKFYGLSFGWYPFR